MNETVYTSSVMQVIPTEQWHIVTWRWKVTMQIADGKRLFLEGTEDCAVNARNSAADALHTLAVNNVEKAGVE